MVTMIMTTKWIFFFFFSFRFSYWALKLPVKLSCGLFNLDAKDLEQSSAQEVYIVLDVPIYRPNYFPNSDPQLLCRRRSYSS